MSSDLSRTLPCVHTVDQAQVAVLVGLLGNLPKRAPDLVEAHGLPSDPAAYSVLYSAAIEQIRGSKAATTSSKGDFTTATLDYLKLRGLIKGWGFVGTDRRQDYRVQLPGGRDVAIEAKGCPDGNNTNIWDRPTWADEFVVWSQCPDSLAKQPGKGAWSGIATRLMPKEIAEQRQVDSFIFWDGRCGSDIRRCPKDFGVEGIGLREKATTIPGQRDVNGTQRDWIPPPCIYLFPRTIPRAPSNPNPDPHSLESHRFADVLLTGFNVPDHLKDRYVHRVRAEVALRSNGTHLRVSVETNAPLRNDVVTVEGKWKRLGRE